MRSGTTSSRAWSRSRVSPTPNSKCRPPPDAGSAFVNARGIVEDADFFDAAFFGCNAREAELLDPQHRVFLECAWEALESAGYDPARYPGLIGVWAGSGINSYLLYNIATGHDYLARLVGGYQQGESAAQFSNDRDFLATRLAYKLNLKGPSLTVQTACSTSLVAVAQACQALWSYQTDMALAGGVSISFPQRRGYVYQEGAHCLRRRPHAHVRRRGAGHRLQQRGGHRVAQASGGRARRRRSDRRGDQGCRGQQRRRGQGQFHGSERGWPGRGDPDGAGARGGQPETISYVEAHGTGTPLGDPIEVAGLTQAFRAGGAEGKGFCALGSLKTNVGHMDIASGVAALIKTSLALQHRQLPPTLHFREPNPHLDLPNSPFYVNTRVARLARPRTVRRGWRASVRSASAARTRTRSSKKRPPNPRPNRTRASTSFLSSPRAPRRRLDAATANLARHLREHPALDPADVASRLQTGRRAFDCRRIVAARPRRRGGALERRDGKRVFSQPAARRNPPVAFLFPGQGAQTVDMGAALYRTEPVFRAEIDRCAELLRRTWTASICAKSFARPSNSTRRVSRNRPCSSSGTRWRSCG